MTYNWILEVLSDLKTFSDANGMHRLSKELDEARLMAAVEIAAIIDIDADPDGEDRGAQRPRPPIQ